MTRTKKHLAVLLLAFSLWNSACSVNVVGGVIRNQVNLNTEAQSYLNTQAASSIDNTEIIAYSHDLSALKAQFKGLIIETDSGNASALFRAQGEWSSRLIMQQLQSSSLVNYAEPNIRVDLPPLFQPLSFQTQALSNDPLLQDPQATYPLKLLNAFATWDLSKGQSEVVVAVLDTGFNFSHPDLQGQSVEGYDFVNEKDLPEDDHGHGSHIAGIIAGKNNNSLGGSGLAPNVKIMPLKILKSNKGGNFRNAARAIRWATEKGADVINLSISGNSDNNDLRTAIQEALQKNIVVVAAMGNDEGEQAKYPAFYSNLGVISVGAINAKKQKANFSNYGSWMSVVAPGESIVSTTFQGNKEGPCISASSNSCYTSVDGTSQATPYVSALAALAKSLAPNLSATQIKSVIENQAEDLGAPGFDAFYGHGLISPLKTLSSLSQGNTPTPTSPTNLSIGQIKAIPFYIESGDRITFQADIRGSQTNTQYGWAAGGGSIEGNGSQAIWTAPGPGNYQIIVGAQNEGEAAVFATTSVIVFPTSSK